MEVVDFVPSLDAIVFDIMGRVLSPYYGKVSHLIWFTFFLASCFFIGFLLLITKIGAD
jgi:hypothetical protein